ncbi:MAG: sensor histidine kinase [Burkholderiaceae bacterium]|nr:sensor histidine kinase [Burkholderiaceae bacterium]MEB2351695.1 sensor histidine kinase [Burkholderiaceae bacterium]
MNSLRNRLSLALSLVLLAAAALLAIGLQDFPRRLVEGFVGARLEHDAEMLYTRVLDAADPEAAAQDAAGSFFQLPLSGHYFVIGVGGQLIRSRSLWDEDLATPAATQAGFVRRVPGPAGQRLLVFAKRFAGAGAGAGITVTVAEDVSAIDDAIARFRAWLLAGVALALLGLLALQRVLLVRGLAPLDDAVAACRRIERGEPPGEAARSPARLAPSEVQPMLDALDRLARHHAQRLGRIRHAVGNLSHALKTPLAVLSQQADDLATRGQADAAASMREQLDAMRATIERELRRARLAGGNAPGEPVELHALLGTLAEVLQQLHRDRGIAIEVDAAERRIAADREDLLELFGNLLDNACKWARQRVRVSVAPAPPATDALEFSVEDDGPGVPEELLGQLGAAGMRIDEQRPGHGLGLAIAADIVAQYGGSIRYRRSAALGGLQAQASLPLARG